MLPAVATTVGQIIKEIGGAVTKPVAVTVEQAIKGLIATNQTLTTGGVQLPALQYDQARDLVAAVAQISNRPIALFLDQWEKSPDPKFEAKILGAFLHHLADWPQCHIFMALRPDDAALRVVNDLVSSLKGPAQIYRLKEMELNDEPERARLLRSIRASVPVIAEANADFILEQVGGYPGVIYQWTSDYQRAHMKSPVDLAQVARDAQAYRFSELERLLDDLDDDQQRLAIRLALVPMSGAEAWPEIEHEVLDGLGKTLVDSLRAANVLEEVDPPSFGHAKRWEMAQSWLIEHRKIGAHQEAASLIRRLAAPIHDISPDIALKAATLWALLPASLRLGLDHLSVALCQSAGTLFAEFDVVDEALIRAAKQTRNGELAYGLPLLAMGLFNTLNHAKAEDDLARRDKLLDELRALAKAHPDEPAVREQLAMGLFNTLYHAKAEDDLARRDKLLDELRALAQAHPDEPAVREQLAMGLFNTLNHAKAEDDLARRDELLDELRALAQAHPEEATMLEVSARLEGPEPKASRG